MNDDNGIEDFLDMAEKGIDLLRENEDLLGGFSSDGETLTIDDTSPLKSATADDDMVYITIEAKGGGVGSIEIAETGDGVAVGMNGEVVDAKVPDDVDVDDAEAELNNGVLEVRLPRTGGEN